ncbi:hypothetical protein PEBR_09236 [Penicillium brasilianum]|uniref:Amino acid permease/ SLC12A domain-containing protein n=1 Tax=Penicillium brasilianum TaxID=104259 RepID=A0A1S9S1U7_PENBI|nr:hypothetical protein PEBR_09236 [Penicillium brasilianum]
MMVFSFIGASLLTLAVTIPLAEMCSMYPVDEGQYSWVEALTPLRFARGFPEYTFERWQTVLVVAVLSAVTGVTFLLTRCFGIGDITETAVTSTGVSVIQIIYNSTGSKVATCILSSLIAVIVIVAGVNILAEGSRSVFAFARENGLPFLNVFSKVASKSQVPVNTVLLTLAVQLALDVTEFDTTPGSETVVSISTEGFYLSYAMALFSRLIGYFSGHVTKLEGSYFILHSGVDRSQLFLSSVPLFASISFNFPTTAPVNEE